MLSREDNELLCRVAPGTPMGDLMRQFWLPALLSSELPSPDCPPTRLRLLGENLIAFRTTSGRIGAIQNACPHRGASMFFGRNEEEGLRCVYHGWKFDVEGTCIDMPSEPPESNFKTKVKTVAYPCTERNGVVWLYMGPRDAPPPLPDIEPNMLEECRSQKTMRSCNWMQALEGDIDTSHAPFLHRGGMQPEDTTPGSMDYYELSNRTPGGYSVLETDFGTCYGAWRPADNEQSYWRVAHYLVPCYTMIPTGVLGRQVLVRAWVPIDDEHTMFWNMSAGNPFGAGGADGRGGSSRRFNVAAAGDRGGQNVFLPDTSDWLGKFRIDQTYENDYLIDREVQREGKNFTGIDGIFTQDQCVTETMGAVSDRMREHLGSSDQMVIRSRRFAINAARALRQNGTVPFAVDHPEVYRERSGGTFLARGVDWWEATAQLRKAFVQHPSEATVPVLAVDQ
jgi:phenylpropionate dioxygenase-like ring-hydroxylating dioxygenase large terminal subunit